MWMACRAEAYNSLTSFSVFSHAAVVHHMLLNVSGEMEYHDSSADMLIHLQKQLCCGQEPGIDMTSTLCMQIIHQHQGSRQVHGMCIATGCHCNLCMLDMT